MINFVDTLTIVHNEAASRFEATIEEQLAVVDYERRGDVLYFTHTEIPMAFRGQGIADAITRVALDYAKAEGLGIVPICSFTRAYLDLYPEYKDVC